MKNRKFRILTVSVCVIAVISLISVIADDSFLSSAVNSITYSMQSVAANIFGGDTKQTYDELAENNKTLEEENASLRSQLVDYYDTKRENARLWRYYDLKKENPNYEFLPASVIRRDPNDDFYSFTIDMGSSDGVSVNDPVITENGVVGRIYETSLNTSTVKTVLSPETKIGAIDSRTTDSGVITGNAKYCDDNLMIFTGISANSTLAVGDIIVTSGLSGVFPVNLVLGEIKELTFDSYDTTQIAVISPYEDIRAVSDVLVLTNFNGKGEIKTQETQADLTGE